MANLENDNAEKTSELDVQGLAIDAICDTPLIFECTARYLFGLIKWIDKLTIERITLGHYLLIQKKLSEIGYQITATVPEIKTITAENVAEVVMFNLESVIEIIALSVCDTKQEITDLNYVEKLRKIIYKHFTLETYCYAMLGILEKCKTDFFVKHFKIEEDWERRKTQNKYESVGGRTLWGSIIQVTAKNYGWGYDDIIWGLSYQNLMMMSHDESWVDYDSGKGDESESKSKSKGKNTKTSTGKGKKVRKMESFEDLLSFAKAAQQ